MSQSQGRRRKDEISSISSFVLGYEKYSSVINFVLLSECQFSYPRTKDEMDEGRRTKLYLKNIFHSQGRRTKWTKFDIFNKDLGSKLGFSRLGEFRTRSIPYQVNSVLGKFCSRRNPYQDRFVQEPFGLPHYLQ